MNERQAINAFAALAQETRLHVVKILVVAGPEGLPASALGESVGASSSNTSFHLKELERAGLVQSRRVSRSIIYSADFSALSGLIQFLMRDCCNGRPEVCGSVFAALASLCDPKQLVPRV